MRKLLRSYNILQNLFLKSRAEMSTSMQSNPQQGLHVPHCWKSHVVAQILVVRAEIHKMDVGIAKREDPDLGLGYLILSV